MNWTIYEMRTYAEERPEKFWQTIIVQQSLDASNGYKNLIKWRHDLRVYLSWTSIIDSVVRQQQPWSNDFRVSVALWWKALPLNKEEIPTEVINMVKEIVPILAPKTYDFYSLDFIYDSNEEEWYLIEANSAPWFRNERDRNDVKNIIVLQSIEKCIKTLHKKPLHNYFSQWFKL